jgi:hypothetical protein
VDVSRLNRGERIAGVAAVLLFIDLFLHWYSANVSSQISRLAARAGVSTAVNAWDAFSTTDILLLLTIIVALAMVAMTAAGRIGDLPVSLALVTAALGALMTLVVLYRIINQPGPNDFINVEYGAYLGLVLVAALTYGALEAAGGMEAVRAGAGSVQDRANSSAASPPPAPPPAPGAASVAEQPPPAAPPAAATVPQPAPPPVAEPAPDPEPEPEAPSQPA